MATRDLSFLLTVLLAACGDGRNPEDATEADRAAAVLERADGPEARKSAMDTLMKEHPERLQVYADAPGGAPPEQVIGGSFPDNWTTAYTVLRDEGGTVLLVAAAPFSESGDWDISLVHYFDRAGRTFAFERRASFFNSGCTDGVAYERATRYYDTTGRETSAVFALQDAQGKDLVREHCSFPYDFPYTMYTTLGELAQDVGLPVGPGALTH